MIKPLKSLGESNILGFSRWHKDGRSRIQPEAEYMGCSERHYQWMDRYVYYWLAAIPVLNAGLCSYTSIWTQDFAAIPRFERRTNNRTPPPLKDNNWQNVASTGFVYTRREPFLLLTLTVCRLWAPRLLMSTKMVSRLLRRGFVIVSSTFRNSIHTAVSHLNL